VGLGIQIAITSITTTNTTPNANAINLWVLAVKDSSHLNGARGEFRSSTFSSRLKRCQCSWRENVVAWRTKLRRAHIAGKLVVAFACTPPVWFDGSADISGYLHVTPTADT